MAAIAGLLAELEPIEPHGVKRERSQTLPVMGGDRPGNRTQLLVVSQGINAFRLNGRTGD